MAREIPRRYVSLSEAATYTGLTERYLTDAIKSGRLTAYCVNPDAPQSRYRIRLEDLDAMLEAGRVRPA